MRSSLCMLALLSALGAFSASAEQTLLLGPFAQRMADRYTARHGLPNGAVSRVQVRDGRVEASAASGSFRFEGGRWLRVGAAPPLPAPPNAGKLPGGARVRDWALGANARAWVVTDAGVFRSTAGGYERFTPPRAYLTNQTLVNIDFEASCVVADRNGTVWLGTDAGIFATDGANFWNVLDRTTGLPFEYVTCLAIGPDATLWAGTREGVCRYLNGEWQYYWGPRWLPHNHVNDIAAAPDGGAWVATEGGVARLYEREVPLAAKAAHYQQITDARHNRRGFVTGSRLKVPGDLNGGVVHEASDNDGLWTAMYVGAQSFRWAATKDPAAREAARKSMHAMLDLVRFSGVPGFPARAIIRKGEEVDGYDPEETVRVPGEKDKIWYRSPVDPQVLCKGDTSSDELDGHYFAWSVYYDLVADDDERKAVRATVAAVTDNLLQHDLNLVGHTGRPTRWGIYSPRFINDDPYWWEERGLNSLSILSYLKIAHHITGQDRFHRKYRELIEKHHYLLNTVNQKNAEPWHAVNHSDDEMAFMMYYAILKLEKDPATRLVLLQSLERSWKIESPEESPFFNFVYGASTGRPCDLEASVGTLREWPWELIEWQSRGSHRHDVTMRTWSGEGATRTQATRVLPAGERRLMRWNGNPYQCDGGTPEGRSEEDGSAWLLPYWMGRHHGFILERSPGRD